MKITLYADLELVVNIIKNVMCNTTEKETTAFHDLNLMVATKQVCRM